MIKLNSYYWTLAHCYYYFQFFRNLIDYKNCNLINDYIKYIGKDASFDNIYNLDGLDNLEIIEGDAEFKNLKVLGTNKLKYIGGDAYFDNIEDIRELDNIKINGVVFSNKNFYKGRMI